MYKTVTKNIHISVVVKYWPNQSLPKENHYFFVYYITIENKSEYTVQLMNRHWDIVDTQGENRTVDGEGVIGETPVLEPGEVFKYNSGCNLTGELGYMKGYYTMKRLLDNEQFNVQIPRFDMVVPAKLN
ncbi:MAG: Co2+/Mg2+ efflux protein ApaG [Sediminibacterium sp.]|nr:Co2+/Mg2+ efflux protein ApaG [Sediminibacterium sp.]